MTYHQTGLEKCCECAAEKQREIELLTDKVAALEQKLLASEVRGRQVHEKVVALVTKYCLEENRTQTDEETLEELTAEELPKLGDFCDRLLRHNPSHYSSQVEAIGKMVGALEKISLHCGTMACGEIATKALTTWNSLKGETEGKA